MTGRSPADRAADGRAARARTPRRSHAEWAPATGRPDPVELLRAQAVSYTHLTLPTTERV